MLYLSRFISITYIILYTLVFRLKRGIKVIIRLKTDGEKRRAHKLIQLGGLVAKAGMGDYPKPFLLGLFLKCKREIVPTLTRQELDRLSEDGYNELLKGAKKKAPKKADQPDARESEIKKPKRKEYFYDKVGGLEPWMSF